MMYDFSRFYAAQNYSYATALAEIRCGRKQSHWMWYIFPQLRGLGRSDMSQYYALADVREAMAYLEDPVLGPRLKEISGALLDLPGDSARAVMGSPDDMKLRSCMTLFALADPYCAVFRQVLDKYFGGKDDPRTLRLLGL